MQPARAATGIRSPQPDARPPRASILGPRARRGCQLPTSEFWPRPTANPCHCSPSRPPRLRARRPSPIPRAHSALVPLTWRQRPASRYTLRRRRSPARGIGRLRRAGRAGYPPPRPSLPSPRPPHKREPLPCALEARCGASLCGCRLGASHRRPSSARARRAHACALAHTRDPSPTVPRPPGPDQPSREPPCHAAAQAPGWPRCATGRLDPRPTAGAAARPTPRGQRPHPHARVGRRVYRLLAPAPPCTKAPPAPAPAASPAAEQGPTPTPSDGVPCRCT